MEGMKITLVTFEADAEKGEPVQYCEFRANVDGTKVKGIIRNDETLESLLGKIRAKIDKQALEPMINRGWYAAQGSQQ